ncbi:MAG: ATP-binding cassette domain-containing protein [Actinomycetota bacterium]|nr:ATP-binding cassette domain-containing protein [Actinomycetota bacterium]
MKRRDADGTQVVGVAADTDLLRADAVEMHFSTSKGMFGRAQSVVRAVDDVSFVLKPGETLGLVGESGCGKSTLARIAVGLLTPSSGVVRYRDTDINSMSRSQIKEFRRNVQIVFQDPFASLDPRRTVFEIVTEPLRIHRVEHGNQLRSRATELLEMVGLGDDALDRRPKHFSGGQRQRIGIARALALTPSVIILDEPVSALDVSIQAQFLNLLQDLKDTLGHSYLLISHDLAVVGLVADTVAVMYLGKIVESGPVEQVFTRPVHPYTAALLSAVPNRQADGGTADRIVLEGEMPNPASPPSGCSFRTRCWKATPKCAAEQPPLVELASNQFGACHYPES